MSTQDLWRWVLPVALLILFSKPLFANVQIDAENNRFSFTLSELGSVPNDTLAFQFDGYDVTELVWVDGDQLILQFSVPISPGGHALQVLQFTDDGEIRTLYDDQIWIDSDDASNTSWQANIGFTQRYRLNEKNYPQDSVPKDTTGSLNLSAEQARQGSLLHADVSGVYDLASQNNPDLNEWAIAQYKLMAEVSGEKMKGSVTVGHIQPKQESLLFSGFERRGMAVDVGSTDDQYRAQVFSLNTLATTAYDQDLTVPDDNEERSLGATSSASIWEENLILSVNYIDAKTDFGEDDPQFRRVYGGDAWSTALDSFLFSNRFWMHLEYAESTFDSDGYDVGDDEKRDEAQQALIQLSSDQSEAGFFDYWSAELRYQEVGEDFYSLGNFSLPGDVRMHSGRAEASVFGVTLQGEVSQEETNIDQQTDRVTQTLDVSSVGISYSPLVDAGQGAWLWIGAPTLSLSHTRSDNKQPWEESVLFGFDLNQSSDETMAELSFNSLNFYWGVSAQQFETKDKAQEIFVNGELIFTPGPDQEQKTYSAFWGWQPDSKTFLNLFTDVSRHREKGVENEYRTQNYGVEGQVELLADKADFQFAYNRSYDQSEYSEFEDFNTKYQSEYGNAKLIWHWQQADHIKPNIDTFLNGVWNLDQDKLTSTNLERWAIYMGIDIAYSGAGS